MADKYLVLVPPNGISNVLSTIRQAIDYCDYYERTLLVYKPYVYDVNLGDYFKLGRKNVILDSNKVVEIISQGHHTVYPTAISSPDGLIDLLINPGKLRWGQGGIGSVHKGPIIFYSKPPDWMTKNLYLPLCNVPPTLPTYFFGYPDGPRPEDIILVIGTTWGEPFRSLFSEIQFTPQLKSHAQRVKLMLDKKPYLCLHVRDSDIQSDYRQLYSDNKGLINQYETVYLCTDNHAALDFFKEQHPRVLNNTRFGDNPKSPLHLSTLDGDIKIKDLISDIVIATFSNVFLTNSDGDFTKLMRECFTNKENIAAKIEDNEDTDPE
tara:strand:- start:396 stop:1361 length:966 start_codon:yes stop_codon:yes gene_type:complete